MQHIHTAATLSASWVHTILKFSRLWVNGYGLHKKAYQVKLKLNVHRSSRNEHNGSRLLKLCLDSAKISNHLLRLMYWNLKYHDLVSFLAWFLLLLGQWLRSGLGIKYQNDVLTPWRYTNKNRTKWIIKLSIFSLKILHWNFLISITHVWMIFSYSKEVHCWSH